MRVTMIYKGEYTKVYDSYKYDPEELTNEIIKLRYKNKLPITRDHLSYKAEIKAHNRLYNLGLFRSHTKDTDLEENIKKWKEVIFKIIGR